MKRLQLATLFQNHMVLQREKPILIRGTVAEEMTLHVTLDRTTHSYPITAGAFQISFPAQDAGRSKTLAFYCNQEKTPEYLFEDVSIGDIWLAAGQSNMEYFLRYDAHWNETCRLPVNPDIHMYNCPQIAFEGQKRSLPYSGYWFQQNDEGWREFSAPGYYFAQFLQPTLNVPIGIIGCNWGGTPACAWMDEATLAKEPLTVFKKEYEEACKLYSPEEMKSLSMTGWAFEDSYRHQLEWRAMMYGMTEKEQAQWMQEHADDPVLPLGPYHHYRPSGLYHTMLETLAPFSIKGILWYQGESDSNHADIYDKTMTALIQCFRDTFKQPDLPFLFVQLAPFGKWLNCTGDHYALIRQQQDKVAQTIKKTYMTSIMDLGMYEDIHPKEKREVGRRLALLARENVYGESVSGTPATLSHAVRQDNVIRLFLKDAADTLHGCGNLTENFEVYSDTKIYTVMSVTLDGSCIELQIEGSTNEPLTISYANKDYCNGNIWNAADLPLKPFVIPDIQ